MSWYVEVWKKYAVFSGRARRKEYWMFSLFNMIISFGIGFVEGFMGIGGDAAWGPISGLYLLAVIIPSIAVTIRRLHDTDRSGWWIFIAAVPFLGALALLWFFVQEGSAGDNQYGPNPKSPLAPSAPEPQRAAAPMG